MTKIPKVRTRLRYRSREPEALISIAALMIAVYINLALFLPWLIGILISPDAPQPDPDFVEEIESNAALWPTKELRDSLVYGLSLFLVIGMTVVGAHRNLNRVISRRLFVVAAALSGIQVAFAMAQLDDRLRPLNPGYYFEGFDFNTTAMAIVTAVTVLFASHARTFVQLPAQSVLVVSLVPSLLALLQFSSNNLDSTNSQFVFNELLAVSAGRWPLIDFSTQYSAGLPFLVAGVNLLGIDNPIVALGLSLTAFNILVVGVLLVAILMIESNRVLRTFFSAVVVTSAVFTTARNGSLSSYFQAMPIRALTFSMMIVAVYGISQQRHERWIPRIIGISTPILLLINFEFGAVAGLTVIAAAMFTKPSLFARGSFLKTCAWVVSPLLLLQIGLFLLRASTDSSCRTSCGLEFVSAFGGKGFFKVPMLNSGLHLVMIATFGSGVLASFLSRRLVHDWRSGELRFVLPLLLATSLYGLGGVSVLRRTVLCGQPADPLPALDNVTLLAHGYCSHAFGFESDKPGIDFFSPSNWSCIGFSA